MNFNYGYNFNLRNTKIEQQKPETKGQGEEVKEEEQASPKAAPETVVLTGDAADIQAAIAKATVRGAMGPQEIKQDRDGGLEQAMSDYLEYKQYYLDNVSSMSEAEIANCLANLMNKISNMTEVYGNELTQNAAAQSLIDDYHQWKTDLAQASHGTQFADVMDQLFYDLENTPNSLNAQLMYNLMDPGIGRVNYFRGKVKEFQRILSHMDSVAQRYWNGNIYSGDPRYIQFRQWKIHFQQKLAEAQHYLELSLQDLPSRLDPQDPEQSQTAR